MDVGKLFNEGLDQIQKLPEKVKNAVAQIHDYDAQCEDKLKTVKTTVCGYVIAVKKMTNEQKRHQQAEIAKKYEELDTLAKKKLKIASDLYDSVDHEISVMDKNAKKLEARSRKAWHTSDDDDDEEPVSSKGGRRKRKKNRKVEEPRGSNLPNVDMPVDPNEPFYCTCHQVSFGEMVCCDNTDCKIEWFHFQCVGMSAGPPSSVKWFCEACRPSFKHVPNQWIYATNEPPRRPLKKAKVNRGPAPS